MPPTPSSARRRSVRIVAAAATRDVRDDDDDVKVNKMKVHHNANDATNASVVAAEYGREGRREHVWVARPDDGGAISRVRETSGLVSSLGRVVTPRPGVTRLVERTTKGVVNWCLLPCALGGHSGCHSIGYVDHNGWHQLVSSAQPYPSGARRARPAPRSFLTDSRRASATTTSRFRSGTPHKGWWGVRVVDNTS
jgi:hypothetical protein